MVKLVSKYGSVKVKYTANAICRRTLVLQAAQVVKADALKAQHLLVHAAKEAVSAVVIVVVMIAEAATLVAIAEAVVHRVQARIVAVVTVLVAADLTVVAAIALADLLEEDN